MDKHSNTKPDQTNTLECFRDDNLFTLSPTLGLTPQQTDLVFKLVIYIVK